MNHLLGFAFEVNDVDVVCGEVLRKAMMSVRAACKAEFHPSLKFLLEVEGSLIM